MDNTKYRYDNGEMVEQSFDDYIQQSRDEFVHKINAQEWNTELRTAAEDLLICFDQMKERLKQQTS